MVNITGPVLLNRGGKMHLNVGNPTPHARQQWFAMPCPLRGVTMGKTFEVFDGETLWGHGEAGANAGARGQWFPVYGSLDPWQEKTLTFEVGDDLAPGNMPWTKHDMPYWSENLASAQGKPLVLVNDEQVNWSHINLLSIASGFGRITVRGRTHDESPFAVDMYLEFGDGQSFMQWKLLVNDSNPAITTLNHPLKLEIVAEEGGIISAENSRLQAIPHSYSRLLLVDDEGPGDDHVWGNGQRRAWRGAYASEEWINNVRNEPVHLETGFAGLTHEAILFCDNWEDQGNWGPLGLAPWMPFTHGSGSTGVDKRVARWWTAQEPRAPWATPPLGAKVNTTWTGEGEDHGVSHCEWIFAERGVRLMPSHLYSAYLEARRPNGFREQNAVPIDPSDHPSLILWMGYPHWVSPDQLGKVGGTDFNAHSFWGPDRQHWSNNLLCGMSQLTGDPVLQQLVRDQITVWLGGETLNPSWSTSHAGTSRGIGRTMMAGCWLYLSCGEDALRERLKARMQARLDQVILPELTAQFANTEIKPLATKNPHPNNLNGQYPFWTPWEDALAIPGIYSLFKLFGWTEAYDLALQTCKNLVRYGMWEHPVTKRMVIGQAVRWLLNGAALDPSAYLKDGPKHQVNSYNPFNLAATAAMIIAHHLGAGTGDVSMRDRAAQFLTEQHQERESQLPGNDKWAKWVGVSL